MIKIVFQSFLPVMTLPIMLPYLDLVDFNFNEENEIEKWFAQYWD